MNGRRIDTVLRVRELHERLARTEVVRRRGDLDDRRRTEASARQAVETRARHVTSDPRTLLAQRMMLRAGVAEIATARISVAAASDHVVAAMSSWHDAARRLDGIERLAVRVRAEIEADAQRAAANELDDLVVMRHGSEERS